MEFILTSAPGLEELTKSELTELGVNAELDAPGALRFEGTWEDAANVLTYSRTASRLLITLRKFTARNQAMLYDQCRRIEWAKLFKNYDHTFAVFTHGTIVDADYNLKYAALKIKDAICDEVKKYQGDRPNVDRQNPNIRIEAFFHGGKCEISVDLSGEPLHRRGYREEAGEAPLRENRAAALLKFAGWDGTQKLIDPFCGAGTILVEAALLAQNRAPGLLKNIESYAGVHIVPELMTALEKVRKGAAKAAVVFKGRIYGSDISPVAVKLTRQHLKGAGASHLVSVDQKDALNLRETDALIVCNPPYGERLKEEDAADLISKFVRQVKHHCAPATLVLVIPKGELEKSVGLKPEKSLSVENGSMTLKFLKFDIFAGKIENSPKKLLMSGKANLAKKKTVKK